MEEEKIEEEAGKKIYTKKAGRIKEREKRIQNGDKNEEEEGKE